MIARTHRIPLALLAAGLCLAAVAMAGERVDETRQVNADARIRIESLAGTLEVVGWDRNEVRLQGELDPKAKKLEIKGGKGNLEIEVKYPRKIRGGVDGSKLTLQVPHGCRLHTETVSCDVSVHDVDGEIEIDSVSGEITVTGEPGKVEISSVSGVIELEVTADDVEIDSVSGEIFVQGVRRRLAISSVSGDVEVKADVLDAFAFNAVSGELDLTADPALDGRWDIDCHSGEVTLYLPADVSAEFEIDTFSGDIDDDFGHEARRTHKHGPGKELSFTQGDGSASIEISVFSGEVNLVKR